MANFSFLEGQKNYKMFASAAIEAEKVYTSSPAMCAIGCRKALELAVKWVYAVDKTIDMPYRDNLQSLIHEPSFKDALGEDTWKKLPYIIKLGNLAVHTGKNVSPQEGIFSLKGLFEFVQWIDYCYGDKYEERTFNEQEVPSQHVELDIEKIKKQESLVVAKDAQIKAMEQKLADMADALAKAKATNVEQRSFSSEGISEYETRKRYIDLDLKLMGWTFKGEAGYNVVEEYEVNDMTNVLGQKGFVDYLLFGDNGLPLAVVEAKRTSLDPKKGKKQAELYADCIERKFKRRPFIFYTNGFETYFWDDVSMPERLVSSVFSKEDLEKLMNRRSSAVDPGTIQIDENISGRHYQIEAIRAVCDGLRNKSRRHLLVMATGTGKTRTAASLTDVMSKAGQVTNVLFLADRRALVRQARDAFKDYLPKMPLCNLCENKQDFNSRIVFSTYPTMLGAIDDTKSKNGSLLYTPAHFDMIIIDEAHRSIFKKYKVIFDYFDAILVGLTATPKTEVDKNTYEFFQMEDNVPTFAYEYNTAVKEGYLVPYYNYEVKSKFVSEGIDYDQLSDDDKKRYEDDFTEDGTNDMPEYIAEGLINKIVFNRGTVDRCLTDLMERGIKINGGDKLGKSIIFAATKEHARYIVERFDKLYPQYAGHFASVVICEDDYAQSIIDDFKVPDKNPFIAVSVDMMDTGIDVPELVNLVFFKKVHSKTKFWQMIGRGTRLCENLNCVDSRNGEYEDKKYFFIFDYGQNFEFFRAKKNGVEGNKIISLTESIFIKQITLIKAMQEPVFAEEKYQAFRNELIDIVVGQILALNKQSVVVRLKRRYVEAYNSKEAFQCLSSEAVGELCKEIAPLVYNEEQDEYAKRFDNFMYGLMIAFIEKRSSFNACKNQLTKTAEMLEGKSGIPQVKNKLPEIKLIQSDEYWKANDILLFENTRKELRDLIQLLYDGRKTKIIKTVLTDPIVETKEGEILPIVQDFENYKKKVNRYIEENKDSLAIFKLTHNKPITDAELHELQNVFLKKLGNEADYKREFKDTPVGILVRNVAGMDKESVRDAFTSFINSQKLNQNQIVFVEKLIDYVCANGYVKTDEVLEKAPFDKPKTIYNIFEGPQLDEIFDIIDSFKRTAMVEDVAG